MAVPLALKDIEEEIKIDPIFRKFLKRTIPFIVSFYSSMLSSKGLCFNINERSWSSNDWLGKALEIDPSCQMKNRYR